MVDCQCSELACLDRIPSWGMYKYSREHLEIFEVDEENWEVIYICPDTGIKFHKESIYPEYHGGGIPIWTVLIDK